MWTLQDAKNRFSAVVEAALSGAPQQVTRRGKPAVVVLAQADYEKLVQNGSSQSFLDHLLALPQGDALKELDAPRPHIKPRDISF